MVEVSTSILTVKKENALGVFYNLEVAKTDYFHIDVMDGKFVKQDTTQIMHEYCNNIKQISNLPLDVHLMVDYVNVCIDSLIPYEPSKITCQLESSIDKEEAPSLFVHIKESTCGIKEAVENKKIFETRYINYKKIYEELKDREEHKW